MRDRSLFRLVVVAVAVLAILGHICVLPLYAESHHEPVAPHATPTEAHGYAASCEAAPPGPSYAAPALMPLGVAIVEPALPLPVSPALVVGPGFSRSSPLFLLHLTLRI